MGWRDARVTPTGPDAGLDVVATGAVAQVKARVGKAGRQELQALRGAAHGSDDVLLFFAMGGFSAEAVAYADQVGMSLFQYGFDGSVEPRNSSAAGLLTAAKGLPAPPAAQAGGCGCFAVLLVFALGLAWPASVLGGRGSNGAAAAVFVVAVLLGTLGLIGGIASLLSSD